MEGEGNESENSTNVADDERFGGVQAKSDFLDGYSKVVLYLWEFSANLNVLTSGLQRISVPALLMVVAVGPIHQRQNQTRNESFRRMISVFCSIEIRFVCYLLIISNYVFLYYFIQLKLLL